VLVEANNLTKTFGTRPALKGVSFRLDGPGVVGLLGPNGSGKTTTLRLLAGFFAPTAGTVLLDGEPIVVPHGKRSRASGRIGYLPENAPLYGEMTVLDYLGFVARLKGLRGEDVHAHTHRVMARLELNHHARTLIGQLSRGYRQRVGLAQALVHDPEFVILDEPTSGLDPVQVEQTRRMVFELGTCSIVVLSTHLLHDVQEICSKVLVLKEGVLVGELPVRTAMESTWTITVRGPIEIVEERLSRVSGLRQVTSPVPESQPDLFRLRVGLTDPGMIESLARELTTPPLALQSLEKGVRDLMQAYTELQQTPLP